MHVAILAIDGEKVQVHLIIADRTWLLRSISPTYRTMPSTFGVDNHGLPSSDLAKPRIRVHHPIDQQSPEWLRFIDHDGTETYLNVASKQVLRHRPHGNVSIVAIDETLEDVHALGQLDSVGSEQREVVVPKAARELGEHVAIGSVSTARSQVSIRELPDNWDDEPPTQKGNWFDTYELALDFAQQKAEYNRRTGTIIKDKETGKFCVKAHMPIGFRRSCAKHSRYEKVESYLYHDLVGAASIDHLRVGPTDPDVRLCACGRAHSSRV